MENKSSNLNLLKASSAKKDEFYTQLTVIEKELKHYKAHSIPKTARCSASRTTGLNRGNNMIGKPN